MNENNLSGCVESFVVNMFISLSPLKLLNLAQLALISKLLMTHRNTPSENVDQDALEQKAKGNIMIFLGKHTVQLAPELSNANLLEKTIPIGSNRTEHRNSSESRAQHKANHYQNYSTSIQDLGQKAKLANKPRYGEHLRRKNSYAPEMSKTLYLPYSTKHNQIQFFDFNQNTNSPKSLTSKEDSHDTYRGLLSHLLQLQGKSHFDQII